MGASVSGSWSGDQYGVWSGSLDDSNLVALNRETNTNTNTIIKKLDDSVTSQAWGAEVTFNLLSNNSIKISSVQSEVNSIYQWTSGDFLIYANGIKSDTARTLEKAVLTESSVTSLHNKIDSLQIEVERLIRIANTNGDRIQQLGEELRSRFYRLWQAVAKCLSVALSPFYRLCEDMSAEPSVQLDVSSDLDVTLTGAVPPLVDFSSGDNGSVFVARVPSEYMTFKPAAGTTDSPLYYSRELRSILAYPYMTINGKKG